MTFLNPDGSVDLKIKIGRMKCAEEVTSLCVHGLSSETLYLHPMRPSVQTIEARRYCPHCGLIRESTGRSIKYFLNRLDEVNRILRRKSRRTGVRHLTTAERRIIISRMRNDPLIADPYGSSFEAQCRRFVEMIMKQRPGVPEWMIRSVLIQK